MKLFILLISNINALMNQKPLCVNCKFFVKDKNECSQYGYVDLITGEPYYEDAMNVRKDKHKCGENAIYFEKNNFRWITDPYYFIKEHQVLVFVLSIYLVPTVWILYTLRI